MVGGVAVVTVVVVAVSVALAGVVASAARISFIFGALLKRREGRRARTRMTGMVCFPAGALEVSGSISAACSASRTEASPRTLKHAL